MWYASLERCQGIIQSYADVSFHVVDEERKAVPVGCVYDWAPKDCLVVKRYGSVEIGRVGAEGRQCRA